MIGKLIGRGALPEREITAGFLRPQDILGEDEWSETLRVTREQLRGGDARVALVLGVRIRVPDGVGELQVGRVDVVGDVHVRSAGESQSQKGQSRRPTKGPGENRKRKQKDLWGQTRG